LRRALTPKGTLVLSSGDSPGRVVGPIGRILKAALLSPFVSQTMRSLVAKPSTEDLQFVKGLIEAGRMTPVIDRTYAFNEAADAVRYVETGRARGKVVISGSALTVAQPERVLAESSLA
jgi:NADPH:quinone reductase-like Zn-dependent oxidoreductase